jgi:hypothetical protein
MKDGHYCNLCNPFPAETPCFEQQVGGDLCVRACQDCD